MKMPIFGLRWFRQGCEQKECAKKIEERQQKVVEATERAEKRLDGLQLLVKSMRKREDWVDGR